MDRELDVRTASLDANLANHGKGGVAHHLIFFVSERLHRRDRDGIARVHAHWVKVLDRANDHTVVHVIPHYLHLELLPADERLFDQYFADRRKIETARNNFIELIAIVGDAAAAPAEREGGTNNERKCSDLANNSIQVRG